MLRPPSTVQRRRDDLIPDQILIALAPDHQLIPPVLDQDHCGDGVAVVVAGHGIAIGACGEDGQNVAAFRCWERRVPEQDYPGFTALAADGDRLGRRCVRLVGQDAPIDGLIEGGTDVVRHARRPPPHICARRRSL